MVVNDLNLLWASSCPLKADTPLVVDTDTVLTHAIALKCFEAVTRRNPQFFEALRLTELAQFPQRH